MSRTKSENQIKLEALKAKLPEGFDARAFKKCRVNGHLDKTVVETVCKDKGFKDKADAVFAFLTHVADKPKSPGKKRGKGKKTSMPNQPEVNLLVKRTYKELTATEIATVIAMLTEIQKERKQQEIDDLTAQKDKIEKQLKELKA